jgi:hypothetical protein
MRAFATIVLLLLAAPLAYGQDTAPAPPAPASLFANQPGWTGLGVTVGNLVTGATIKTWASPKVAVQASVGGGADGNDVRMHIDLLFSPVQWPSPDGQYLLPLYFGLGGVAGHTFSSGATPSSTEAGFRAPVGMSVLVRGNPVELFFEVAPELAIRTTSSPAEGKYTVAADGAIGFRYYL